jgi:hypothetical protein
MRTLKRGTSLFTTSTPGEYFLGTPTRAIRIYTAEQKIIAEHLARGVNEDRISQIAGVSPIAVHNLVTELFHQSLIDLTQGSFTVGERFKSKIDNRAQRNSRPQNDGAFVLLQYRIYPDLVLSSWIDGVTDAGVAVLNGRQNYLLEISGSNRVATLLYNLLLASGCTQVRFSPSSRSRNLTINDLDIGVDGITSKDYGFSFIHNREELRREYSLFPLDKSADYLDEASTPDLVIACGEIDPEKLALWMSYGQSFIAIPHPHGGRAKIGPMVIPGKTPCLRCAELAERDHSDVISHYTLRDDVTTEYPQIAAHAIAAFAAAQIIAYCDARTMAHEDKSEKIEGESQLSPVRDPDFCLELCGKITVVDYQLLAQPQVVAITRHPLCGCAF